jgi:hypothetical protein
MQEQNRFSTMEAQERSNVSHHYLRNNKKVNANMNKEKSRLISERRITSKAQVLEPPSISRFRGC